MLADSATFGMYSITLSVSAEGRGTEEWLEVEFRSTTLIGVGTGTEGVALGPAIVDPSNDALALLACFVTPGGDSWDNGAGGLSKGAVETLEGDVTNSNVRDAV